MNLTFTPHGWADYASWQATDRVTLKRINRLIEDTLCTPASGVGKPEPLKYKFGDVWSRRITEEHRLVYEVVSGGIIVLQARFHYDD